MSVRLCSTCRRPCVGHDGPYGKDCKAKPVEGDEEFREPKPEGEPKTERGPIEPRPVTRADFDALAGQIRLLASAVESVLHERKVPSLSDIITPGKVKPVKLQFHLPPPSWPPSDKSVKTDVT